MKKIALLFLLAIPAIGRSQSNVTYTDKYHSGIAVHKSIDLVTSSERKFGKGGTEVAIMYSKQSDIYDISWMDDTDLMGMLLVFQEKTREGNKYIDDFGKVVYYVEDNLASKGQLKITSVNVNEIDGKRLVYVFSFEELKKAD